MKNFILILYGLLYCLCTSAQQDRTIRSNTIRKDNAILYKSIYKYAQFEIGHILFKNKNIATAKVNYDRLSGHFLFIDIRNDTLLLSQPESIQLVAVNNDTFYFHNKYFLQLITHHATVNLYKKEAIEYSGKEMKGGYGVYSTTSAIHSMNKISNKSEVEKIGVDENNLYHLKTEYFISGDAIQFLKASKNNFRKLFPEKLKILDGYLVANQIKMDQEAALLNLIDYMNDQP